MRIIGGKFKGKLIQFLKVGKIRPLKDSVRENIFNILNHSKFVKVKLKNSKILDLYSGVGSFGIECISRGAKKVIFIEHDDKASNILKENLIKVTLNANMHGEFTIDGNPIQANIIELKD